MLALYSYHKQLKVNKPLGQTADLDIDQQQEGINDTDSVHRSQYQQPSAGRNTADWTARHQITLKTQRPSVYVRYHTKFDNDKNILHRAQVSRSADLWFPIM